MDPIDLKLKPRPKTYTLTDSQINVLDDVDIMVPDPAFPDDRTKDVQTKFMQINVVHRANKTGGCVYETTTNLYPIAFKDVILGFDKETMKPIIDMDALNEIYKTFDMELDY